MDKKNIKSIKLNSKDIIAMRDNMSKTITKYWRIIKAENLMSKKAVKAGLGSGFDLKALYNSIMQMSEKRIKAKLMMNAINNGITEFNLEEAKKTHYYTIFLACEKKEMLAHWEEILKKCTINPTEKAKKGKAALSKTETFTSAKITSIKKQLQLEINKLDKEIADFNDNTTLSIEADDSEIKEFAA